VTDAPTRPVADGALLLPTAVAGAVPPLGRTGSV